MELQREVDKLRDQWFRDEALSSIRKEKVEAQGGAPRLIGSSPAWIKVFKSIGKVASTEAGEPLLGESGTGKEVVARAIYENSGRKGRPFGVVNYSALPPDPHQSELFGPERGAFTVPSVSGRARLKPPMEDRSSLTKSERYRSPCSRSSFA